MRLERREIVGVVRNGGWKEGRVGLTSCEDSSVVRLFDQIRQGCDTQHASRVMCRNSTVVKLGGDWKVSTGCDHEGVKSSRASRAQHRAYLHCGRCSSPV